MTRRISWTGEPVRYFLAPNGKIIRLIKIGDRWVQEELRPVSESLAKIDFDFAKYERLFASCLEEP